MMLQKDSSSKRRVIIRSVKGKKTAQIFAEKTQIKGIKYLNAPSIYKSYSPKSERAGTNKAILEENKRI